MAIQLKNYRTETGEYVALVDDRGYKYLRVLLMESSGLTVREVPKDHARYMRDVVQAKKIPAMTTIARRFRKFGKRVGMTKAAKSFLTNALKAA